jgi:hypothetical protein
MDRASTKALLHNLKEVGRYTGMRLFIPVQEWAEVYFGCCSYTEVVWGAPLLSDSDSVVSILLDGFTVVL